MPEKLQPRPRLASSPVLRELIPAQGSDYSGQDFAGGSIQGGNFFESIFNGCLFANIRIAQSIFQHTEFTEARFEQCLYEDTSFDHSDFVLTNVRNSEFVRCSFQNAEWRDSVFDGVKFRQCIFRNTTTSLVHFTDCTFDDASAASFVGPSKRFSLFAGTLFALPPHQTDFLRTSFGITGSIGPPQPSSNDDPLYELSLRYYASDLTPEWFFQLAKRVLMEIVSDPNTPNLLRLRYLCDICRHLNDENFLSIFAVQLLNRDISQIAASLRDRRQALEVMHLVLALRIGLRERLDEIEGDADGLSSLVAKNIGLQFEFENSYDRSTISEYFKHLARYCRISLSAVEIKSLRQGSTFVEALISTAACVGDVFRFIRYSLSFAAVSLSQIKKIKKESAGLTKAITTRGAKAKVASVRSGSTTVSKRSRRSASPQNIERELVGVRSEDAKSVEVFVDSAGEKILVVGGRVRVTISLQ